MLIVDGIVIVDGLVLVNGMIVVSGMVNRMVIVYGIMLGNQLNLGVLELPKCNFFKYHVLVPCRLTHNNYTIKKDIIQPKYFQRRL